MKAQQKIQGHKRTFLMLTGTLAAASAALASTAAARPAIDVATATAAAASARPPVLGTTYNRAYPTRNVLRGATILERRMVVNTTGVASQRGVLVLVDDSSHVTNAKGMRVGGRQLDSP